MDEKTREETIAKAKAECIKDNWATGNVVPSEAIIKECSKRWFDSNAVELAEKTFDLTEKKVREELRSPSAPIERCPIYDSCGWLGVWKQDGREEAASAIFKAIGEIKLVPNDGFEKWDLARFDGSILKARDLVFLKKREWLELKKKFRGVKEDG